MRVVLSIIIGLIGVIAVTFLIFRPDAEPNPGLQLEMSSNPFPLAVGRTALSFTLTDAEGRPVTDAEIHVTANMDALGMLPLRAQSRATADGSYDLELIWSTMGQWTLDVQAIIPEHDPIHEQYEVFIYPISPKVGDSPIAYRSVRERDGLVSEPARELLIFIPLGAEALMRSGHGSTAEVIPEQILLDLNGQNTLVIQNDDIADHTIGPFFVRSGEMLRQTFTQPANFQGTCSINDSTIVSITVKG